MNTDDFVDTLPKVENFIKKVMNIIVRYPPF
jgi:hypothetical protein